MKAHPNLSPATDPDPCTGSERFGDIEPDMAKHLRLCQKVTGFPKWGPLSKPGAMSKQPPALELEVLHAKLIHMEAQLMCRPREHRPSHERLSIGKQRLLKSLCGERGLNSSCPTMVTVSPVIQQKEGKQ